MSANCADSLVPGGKLITLNAKAVVFIPYAPHPCILASQVASVSSNLDASSEYVKHRNPVSCESVVDGRHQSIATDANRRNRGRTRKASVVSTDTQRCVHIPERSRVQKGKDGRARLNPDTFSSTETLSGKNEGASEIKGLIRNSSKKKSSRNRPKEHFGDGCDAPDVQKEGEATPLISTKCKGRNSNNQNQIQRRGNESVNQRISEKYPLDCNVSSVVHRQKNSSQDARRGKSQPNIDEQREIVNTNRTVRNNHGTHFTSAFSGPSYELSCAAPTDVLEYINNPPTEVVVVDEFPCLPTAPNRAPGNISTTAGCITGSASLSYLAHASKVQLDTKVLGSDDVSIIKGTESSWYYSNAYLSKIPTLAPPDNLLRESSNEEDSVYQLCDDSSRDGGASVETPMIVPLPFPVLADEGSTDRNTTHARIRPILSASKSAAERWKGRWLDIARARSSLQKSRLEKQQQLASASAAESVTNMSQQQWHTLHTQGTRLESPISYSYVYSNKHTSQGESSVMTSPNAIPPPSWTMRSSDSSASVSLRRTQTGYSVFRWWTAILKGDHKNALKMLSDENYKGDVIFCYVSYIADCQDIIDSGKEDFLADSLAALRSSVPHSSDIRSNSTGSRRGHASEDYCYSEEDDGLSAIHLCAKLCHPVCLDHLLRATLAGGVDSRDRTHKRTALHLACEIASLECARILLQKGADPECRDRLGDTALHKACAAHSLNSSSAQVSLVSFLCERSGNGGSLKINTRNKRRETPLMLVRNRDLAVILIAAGADPHFINSEGLDAASLASRRGDSKLLEAVLGCNSFRHSANIPLNVTTTLSARKTVTSNPPGITTTPLHEASKADSISCIRVLLSARYFIRDDLDRLDTPGDSTPLMLACTAGHARVVQELLGRGADVEIEDRRGVTALVLAMRYGHLPCVRLIATARPGSTDRTNSVGESILEMLARILRQDLLHLSQAGESSGSSETAATQPVDQIDQCLQCMTELLMMGATVTDRFIRRFASPDAIDLLKLMKMVRCESAAQNSSSAEGARREKKIVTLNFEVDVCDAMWRAPWPDSELCDVTFLLADGEKCDAHSFIVGSGSTVLNAMLLSEMVTTCPNEDGSRSMTVISLPYYSMDTFTLLLNWMYDMNDVTETFDLAIANHQAALLDLLYLSNELLVGPLQRLCEYRIGRHIGYFNKDTVHSLGVSLNLQLLLMYYHKSYPPPSSIVSPPCSTASNKQAEIIDEKMTALTKGDVGISDGGNKMCDQSIERMISATDAEWCARLASAPAEDYYAIGNVTNAQNLERKFRSNWFNADGPESWWLQIMIMVAYREGGVKEVDSSSPQSLLSVGQADLVGWCSDFIDEKAEGTKDGNEVDYTISSKLSTGQRLGVSRSSFLTNLDTSDRLRCMLTDLRRRTLVVSITPDQSPSQHIPDDEGQGSPRQSISETFRFYRRSILECEPFVAMNTTRFLYVALCESAPFETPTAAIEDVFSARLSDITPACILYQERRANLLFKPEKSQFDVLIVLIAPSSDNVNKTSKHDHKLRRSPELWGTDGDDVFLHAPGYQRVSQEEYEELDIIPSHRAILSVGSGKLSAMMHFTASRALTQSNMMGSKKEVSVLKVDIDSPGDAVADFKDLIWFMYTGVLRDRCRGCRLGTAEDIARVNEQQPQGVESEQEERDSRLLRLLWLADEYLMPNLTLLLEHRMLENLNNANASSSFMAAQALGLRKLRLAAGILVLYSVSAAADIPQVSSASVSSTHCPPSVSLSGQDPATQLAFSRIDTTDTDVDDSTAFVLLEILRSLTHRST